MNDGEFNDLIKRIANDGRACEAITILSKCLWQERFDAVMELREARAEKRVIRKVISEGTSTASEKLVTINNIISED